MIAGAADRAPAARPAVLFLQTADPDRYRSMLAITGASVTEYCRRHGFAYESHIGVKRGFHPWQATFNRIPMLVELVERGFDGWAIYLDADAYIHDLDFDLIAYLADKGDRAAIFATSGVTGEDWDVNAGVAFVNLGHPLGRALVERWAAAFAAHDDATLRDAVEWMGAGNDQDLLHHILRDDAAIARAVLVEPMSFINGPRASFIRQQLRAMEADFEERLAILADAVAAAIRGPGRPAPRVPPGTDAERRWAARFAHPEGRQPGLAEAPVASVRLDLAERLCSARRAAGGGAGEPLPDHLLDFDRLLREGDAAAVAAELAGLGKGRVALGLLGGERQHARAARRRFADRLARWTYDRLVSLAEAVGALAVENPENGPWGLNGLTDPAELFAGVEAALGVDLSPPAGIGGHLGIAVGRDIILHMRMIDAIHAAWRLRQIADVIGLGNGARIVEWAPGSGLTAAYAARLGLGHYRLFDRPAMNAVQGHVLADAGASLAGEPDAPLAVRPLADLAALAPGSVDMLFDGDALPALDREDAVARLRLAARLGVRHILSINPEAQVVGHVAVAELVREAGGYRLASRHRHWLRAGYVEEHYILD